MICDEGEYELVSGFNIQQSYSDEFAILKIKHLDTQEYSSQNLLLSFDYRFYSKIHFPCKTWFFNSFIHSTSIPS